MKIKVIKKIVPLILIFAASFFSAKLVFSAEDYQKATNGTVCFGEGCRIKVLLEAANFGSNELEMAEMIFQPGYQGRGHPHTSTEIFYVVSGQFGHEVNGKSHLLTAGMVGVVKPGDVVRHSVPGDEPAKVLVLWLPGGEIDRIFDRSKGTPVE